MGLEPLGRIALGRIALEHDLVRPHLSKWRINTAIEFGWAIAYAGYAATVSGLPRGPRLATLART